MTRRASFDEERVFEARRPVTDALPLFAGDAPAVPRVEMPGPRTEAKRIAHDAATKSLAGRRGKILAAVTAYGPMTRLRLSEVTGLTENSCNSACHSLLASGHLRTLDALDPVTHRSVVALPDPEAK